MLAWLFKHNQLTTEPDRRMDSETRARINKEQFILAKEKVETTLQETRDRSTDKLAILVEELQSNLK